jgi:hypothetical protein
VPANAGEEATQMWHDRDPYPEQQHVPGYVLVGGGGGGVVVLS